MKKTRLLLFLLLVVFSLTSVAYADTYKNGSTGKAVEGIQQQLKKLGLFQGEITGNFGPQTEMAVKKFQLKRGLHADGVVGPGTYKYLFEGSKSNTASTKSQSKDNNAISVKEIQAALKKLGYYNGTVDGVTGTNTENAIKKFQKANKLTADGVVGSSTAKFLLAKANNISSQSTKLDNGSKQAMNMKDIQTALKKLGYYNGTVDGVTGSKTKVAIQKFQKANKLPADGVVGSTTQSKLMAALNKTKAPVVAKAPAADNVKTAAENNKPVAPEQSATAASADKTAPKGKVEMLDWWTQASKIFKIGSIATIIDVRTGKTFKLVRTYGTNHADCEALTAKDSQTIKQIWGGWSWTRRPVVVEVDGRKIAASMAAMPHAGVDSAPANKYVGQRSGGYSRGANLDRIKNNGMSGHMDVHFLNSKTHGTNRVDPKHQATVREAAKYNK